MTMAITHSLRGNGSCMGVDRANAVAPRSTSARQVSADAKPL